MRKLTKIEVDFLLKELSSHTEKINKVMLGFKIFGSIQILALLIYIFAGAPKTDIPFMLVGCLILFLVYFKLTGFIINQNQWMKLKHIVLKKKETAYDCTIINTYRTGHGDKQGAKETMANVRIGDKTVRCNCINTLYKAPEGTRAVLVCSYEKTEAGFNFLIPKNINE